MNIFHQETIKAAKKLLISCKVSGLSIGSAESCTGGLLSGLLTSIPGSSLVFDRGFITYTNRSKHEMLGVSLKLLENKGAVSGEVAEMMAKGILDCTSVDLSIAITGIAGPGGGTKEKPVGLVFVAVERRNGVSTSESRIFRGNRDRVRLASVDLAISMLMDLV